MRVLIADEDPVVRRLLSRILIRQFDCTVSECADGLEALDKLSRQRYDLLLLDLVLPVVDGIELLETIRREPVLERVPVVVLTGIREEARVRRAVSLGVRAYIAKPLRPADVAERLTEVMACAVPSPAGAVARSLTGLPDGARVMVVDADRDYRHFVKATLGQQYLIVEADSGTHGLRQCLHHPPSVILLGQDLGMLGREAFMRKMRQTPGLAEVPVVASCSAGASVESLDVDAVVARTYVPQTLKQQFAALVGVPTGVRTVTAARPDVWRHVLSATEQVFGMMLGLSVYATAGEPPSSTDGDDSAFVVLTVDDLGQYGVGVSVARRCAERITQAFVQMDDPVSDEDIGGTLQELANMIGGRVLDALRAHGDTARIGLPVVCLAGAPRTQEFVPTLRAGFSDASSSVVFTVAAGDVHAAID